MHVATDMSGKVEAVSAPFSPAAGTVSVHSEGAHRPISAGGARLEMRGGSAAVVAALQRSGGCLQDAVLEHYNLAVTKTVLVAAEDMS